jgi:hypothetical protein
MFGRVVDAGLPRLDVFDEEFGPGPATILREPAHKKRLWSWTLLCLVLAGAIVSALALAWPLTDGRHGDEVRSASVSPQTAGRNGADDQVTRLLREVAVLKHEIKQLTSAQQQAAETIASLQAALQDQRAQSAYWYSDLAALTFGFASLPEPGIVETTSRRPTTVRARPGEIRRRESGAPLSLDPPQN